MQTEIEIVYEDEFIIAVNKPNNVLVYASYYARNIKEPDLVTILKESCGVDYYPIHRLDRKTSGILLLAKKKEFVKEFQQLFEKSEVSKTYYAVVRGFVDDKGKIDSPTKNADTGKYKDALTNYQSIANIVLDISVHPYDKSRYSLVKLTPKTGRMHQLRIHANKISHPIVGDYKYGDRFHNRMFETEFNWHNMFLHAHSIKFKHPITNEDVLLCASFPKDWVSLFEKFKWSYPE